MKSSTSGFSTILILVVVLVIVAIGWATFKSKQNIGTSFIAPSPTAVSKSSADRVSNDRTPGWTRHVNNSDRFEYEYPEPAIDCDIPAKQSVDCVKVGEMIYIYVAEKSLAYCEGECPIYDKTERVTDAGLEFTRYSGWKPLGDGSYEVVDYETKMKNGKYLRFLLTYLLGKPSITDKEGVALREQITNDFNQIISSFKFLD